MDGTMPLLLRDKDALRFPEPERERWQLLRAGIQNVWEYDDQRFVFHRGHLLLRGQNESGKTKALEVLLPFLLDASLRPERLDPFGSSSRSMRWNLLNEANPEVSTAIGYVWLELGRREGGENRYCTIGAGLRAKRTAPDLDDWYFRTSLRIDRELSLLDDHRVPLRQSRLAELLGERGRVFDSAGDYRRAVNEELFGMPEEQYRALVETLLQLRRPQLSKTLDPEGLSRILGASLPPLDPGAIGSLAEGFERLDRHRNERDELARNHEAVGEFLGVYRGYARSYLKGRALDLTRADSAFHGAREALRLARTEEERAAVELAALVELLAKLAAEDRDHEVRIEALRSSEEFRAIALLDRAEQQARADSAAASSAGARKDRDARELQGAEATLDRCKGALATAIARLNQKRKEASEAAREAALAQEHGAIDALVEAGDELALRGALEAVHRARAAALDALRGCSVAVQAASEAVRVARAQLEQADLALRTARDEHAAAQADELREQERFSEAIEGWCGGLVALVCEPGALLDAPAGERRRLADERAQPERERLAELEARGRQALAEVGQRRAKLQAERESIAASTHRPPAAPAWRAERPGDRPGAPLYLCCDFRRGVDGASQARVEAALEAAGLLDAWVTSDGALFAAGTRDVVLAPEPRGGRTLAELLAPVEGGPVEPGLVDAILRSVALVEGTQQSDAPAWIALDGRFRLGPLHGANDKPAATFVGTTARERARLQRLAELDALLLGTEEERAARDQELALVRERQQLLAAELARFPSIAPLDRAGLRAQVQAETVTKARSRREAAAAERDRTEGREADAVARRDAEAERLGLRAFAERLDELRELTRVYRAATDELPAATREVTAEGARVVDGETRLAAARSSLELSGREHTEARGRAQDSATRVATLREAHGKSREELLAELHRRDARRRELRGELEGRRSERSSLEQRVGAAGSAASSCEVRETEAEQQRRAADEAFRQTAAKGLLRLAEVEESRPLAQWSYTESLLTARASLERTASLQGTTEEQDKSLDKLSDRHADLGRSLREGIRVHPARVDGFTDYRATYNGRELGLLDLQAALAEEIGSRDRLLGAEEHRLFESFLTGEAHEHVRSRLQQAHGLVESMNAQLDDRPTSSGMRLRLRWEVAQDAPPGAAQAIELLLRTGSLLTDANREELTSFLRQRLGEARAEEGAAALQERLLRFLDYRAWRSFAVEFRTANEQWKRLTRKVHGAGSGGQKAVLLHLPLFAAAAAFYESARKSSPRLILLDEAFAGIDRETRAQLMGLLVAFDLDFLMTSFEEWGFYPELDGISTYHLSRERGLRGVYADWFLWDGRERCQVTG